MNEPQQIAAEAWLKIQYHYTPDMTSHTGQTGIAIIQAAIEKVTRVYADRESKRDIMSKMTIARVEELESRAAHASELQLAAATTSGAVSNEFRDQAQKTLTAVPVLAESLPMATRLRSGEAREKQEREPKGTKPAIHTSDSRGGMSPLTDEQANKLIKWRGYSPQIVAWLREQKLVGIYKGAIAFPATGGYHYRKKDGSWRYSEGAKASLFVLGEVEEGAPVHCFESQWCAITYADASGGRDNIVASRGAGNAKLIAEKLKGHTGPIYLWQQNDKAGEKWTQDIRALLPDEQLKLVAIPDYYGTPGFAGSGSIKDLAEWRKKGATDSDVFKVMLDAKTLTAVPVLAESHTGGSKSGEARESTRAILETATPQESRGGSQPL